MAILQGQNNPIQIMLSVDMSTCTDLVVSLSSVEAESCIKHWHKEDVTFTTVVVEQVTKYIVNCPLTQEETNNFPVGEVTIDAKFLVNGYTQFIGTIKDTVVQKYCHEIVGGED